MKIRSGQARERKQLQWRESFNVFSGVGFRCGSKREKRTWSLLDDVDVQIIYGNNTHSLNGLFFFPSFYSLLLLLCDRITFSKCTLLHLRPPLLPIH